jgi:separase
MHLTTASTSSQAKIVFFLFVPLGEFDAHGMVHGYLMGGCSMVIGNLWDVTDKDLDRFCISTLNSMTNCGGGSGGSRSRSSSSSSSSSSSNEEDSVNVLRKVTLARDQCKMKYLIGAAPVCYGVPIAVTCTTMQRDDASDE